jgi:hypothetical protein
LTKLMLYRKIPQLLASTLKAIGGYKRAYTTAAMDVLVPGIGTGGSIAGVEPRMGEAPQGLRRLSCYRPGARPPGKTPARGAAVAEMLFNLEAARALYYRAISEEGLDPSVEAI